VGWPNSARSTSPRGRSSSDVDHPGRSLQHRLDPQPGKRLFADSVRVAGVFARGPPPTPALTVYPKTLRRRAPHVLVLQYPSEWDFVAVRHAVDRGWPGGSTSARSPTSRPRRVGRRARGERIFPTSTRRPATATIASAWWSAARKGHGVHTGHVAAFDRRQPYDSSTCSTVPTARRARRSVAAGTSRRST